MAQIADTNPTEELQEDSLALMGGKRLIVVSNRGPVEYHCTEEGRLEACRGSGGVVTALSSITRYARAVWVAGALTEGDRCVALKGEGAGLLGLKEEDESLRLRFVLVPEAVHERHYALFSNPLLWFLQHSMWEEIRRPDLDQLVQEGWWKGYLPANYAFAQAVLSELERPDTAPCVMLHDYHLYLAPSYIRAGAPEAVLTHFIHIPWPRPSTWRLLPEEIVRAILQGLLANDVVSFQASGFVQNFLATCQEFLIGAEVDFAADLVGYRGRRTMVCRHPISVDVDELRSRMDSEAVRRYQERLLPFLGRQTIVRVDRLEPSKNVLTGFKAFSLLLDRQPELVGAVKFLAFLVPSRTALPEYQRYAERVFSLVDAINGRFQGSGWQPIEVFYENNYEQALAGMGLCDVLLVNSVADGMNLVAKEGPVVNRRDGVLILSRAAGAHEELGREALSIDPNDVEGTARAIRFALTMPPWERKARAQGLRRIIEQRDVTRWLRGQLHDLKSVSGFTSVLA